MDTINNNTVTPNTEKEKVVEKSIGQKFVEYCANPGTKSDGTSRKRFHVGTAPTERQLLELAYFGLYNKLHHKQYNKKKNLQQKYLKDLLKSKAEAAGKTVEEFLEGIEDSE